MSIARHHAEWLSLMEISGPFLSMPVLVDVFPQGLDAPDPDHAQQLRAAYEEWADNQGGLSPEAGIHHAWIRFILAQTLEMPEAVLAVGQAIPEGVKATLAEHGETIRPDMMVIDPNNKKPHLLIHTYPVTQDLNKVVPGRNWKAAPATRMMELLHSTEIRLGLVTNGEQWLLVQAKRGETTGYISWYAGLWLEERLTLRAFRTLLGVGRFFGVPDDQTLPALLDASEKDQQEVTDQLGYQVRRAVEILIQAIDRADQDKGHTLLSGVGEDKLYEAALTVMMRLVFLLSAEERGLLLLGDPIYDQYYAISTLRAQLWKQAEQLSEDVMERGLDAWCRLLATFRAVYGGVQHENLMLPAYGGSLFDPDRFPFLEGRRLNTSWETTPADPLPISNRTVLHLLEALQILRVQVPGGGSAEARRLSFRALDIEQIGHVYEGLLDHKAVRATEPVLGLTGTKKKEPEISLAALEVAQQKGQEAFLALLLEETGRSENALNRSFAVELENQGKERLRTACGNDDALYQRVLPFAGLVRSDDYGWPIVIQTGSVYVTSGSSRRATGTHYTPRSLTEPIVQHTLEPLVYVGPAEGQPREEWLLRSPKELLELKICDMAMGSGAFLVQACRYLSERLVEAWDETSKQFSVNSKQLASESLNTDLQITPEGQPASGDPRETIIPDNDEERLVLARRLVADRCLYGVDKNHLAVEMGKLSLWLITLDKNRPFTFLNHALRHGDSLIGADEEMFLRWAHGLQSSSMPLFDQEIRKLVDEARAKRRALQAFDVREVRDAEEKARLLAEADAATARIKLGCDLLVGARLLDDLNQGEQDALLANGLLDYIAGRDWEDPTASRAVKAAQALPAFHWQFEFPEVFAQSGFSAFIGNPPFMYGTLATTEFSETYMKLARSSSPPWHGKADLVVGFFKRAAKTLSQKGTFSLISTSSLIRGETLESGLADLEKKGFVIYQARSPYLWPGAASVEVVNVSLTCYWKGNSLLDGREVKKIALNLTPATESYGSPIELTEFSIDAMLGIKLSPNNREIAYDNYLDFSKQFPILDSFYVPVIGGQEINGLFDLSTSPRAIDPEKLINIDPYELETLNRTEIKIRKPEFYKHSAPAKKMSEMMEFVPLAFACGETSVHSVFTRVPTNNSILKHKAIIFPSQSWKIFSLIQSNIHTIWAWRWGLRREARLVYSPKRCARTFPYPILGFEDKNNMLDKIGKMYHDDRSQFMQDRGEGLTTIYNRFHNPTETAQDIAHLRQLQVEMDNAVVVTYGWQDLNLGHGFHETQQGIRYTISEPARREVLTRLLQLNHQRYEEEVKLGLHEKKGNKEKAKTTKKKAPKKNDGQMSLL